MDIIKDRPKVLVVLDGTCTNERSHDCFDKMTDVALAAFSSHNVDAEVTIMKDFAEGLSCEPETVMKEIDDKSRKICMDDYSCVVAEGISAWFWMLCAVPMPVICIDPILEPYNALYDVLDNYGASTMKRIEKERGFRSAISLCVVSADNEMDNDDNIFMDNSMIYSDEESDTPEFWEELIQKITPLLEAEI